MHVTLACKELADLDRRWINIEQTCSHWLIDWIDWLIIGIEVKFLVWLKYMAVYTHNTCIYTKFLV